MISSVDDDLPAPPVPVIPKMGVAPAISALSLRAANSSVGYSAFSMPVIVRVSVILSPAMSSAKFGAAGRNSPSRQRCSMSLIMPWRPMVWPSLGE